MTPHTITRRSVLQIGGAGLLALAWPGARRVYAADMLDLKEADATGEVRFPRMVQEYYVARLRAIEEAATARRMGLRTRDDALAYIEDARGKIQQCFAPWPEKTPLNARVTGGFERDAYRVENIIFESRPNFFVTANLYIPKGRTFPLPGVVGTCGHTATGKIGYQEYAQGLARQGYVVLIFDPIGQGERAQYVDDQHQPAIRPGTAQHLLAGSQQFLVGESFAAWRAWDGIRALDYLLTRPEVDPNHVGVVGNSGGGTMTTWLCGVETRWTMAAPSCFVTTFRRNLENEEPQDTEQCPPRALALGLDHADFLAASAPDSIIILAKEKDYFDVRGSETTYTQLRHLYALLGAEDKIGFFAGEGTHGFTQDNREAMYRWFNAVTGVSSSSQEPELTLEPDDALYCAPGGQVAALGSKTVSAFTREKSRALASDRPVYTDIAVLQQAVRSSLRLPDPVSPAPPEFRVLKPLPRTNYPTKRHTRYAVETEPGIFAIVYRLSEESIPAQPPKSQSPALLYVAHISSDYELANEPLLRELMETEPRAEVYACDVRGIGESRPRVAAANSFLSAYGSDYMHAAHGIMLDEPVIGRRTWDVLQVLRWLGAFGHDSVRLAGRGWGTIPATFAAILSEQVKTVTLKAAPASYSAIAEAEMYDWPLATLLPNVLAHFDLPDCYRFLEQKQLRLVDAG